MKITWLMSIAVALMLTTTACQKQDVGMTTGAVLGGVAGSALTDGSTAGTIVGAVGGGFIGREVTQ